MNNKNIEIQNKYRLDLKDHRETNENMENTYCKDYDNKNKEKKAYMNLNICDNKLNSENKNCKLLREPTYYKNIFNLLDKEKWFKPVKEEVNNMNTMKVYKIVNIVSKQVNAITTRWVHKYKKDKKDSERKNHQKKKLGLVATGQVIES